MVKGYLANQLGFSETGRYVLDNLIKPRIEGIGIEILDPFVECAKKLDPKKVKILEKGSYSSLLRYWRKFSMEVPYINNKLMREADCMFAILDGGASMDDGVASEIGYYVGLNLSGPIFALRTDFRLSENIACLINPQVHGYIITNGSLSTTLNGFFKNINYWYESLRKN